MIQYGDQAVPNHCLILRIGKRQDYDTILFAFVNRFHSIRAEVVFTMMKSSSREEGKNSTPPIL